LKEEEKLKEENADFLKSFTEVEKDEETPEEDKVEL